MKSLDLFVPWVAPYVYGAPDPLIKQMLVDAAIEFCGATDIVQTVTVQTVTAGEPRYDIIVPTQQELASVIDVFYLDRRLTAVPLNQVESGAALRAAEDTVVESRVGTPESFYQITPSDAAIYLWPRPDASANDALAVRASFEPVRTATALDDKLYSSVYDIACGAIARLCAMPGQTFTNSDMAQAYERKFKDAKAGTRVEAMRGSVRASLFVRPRPFA